MDMVVQDPKNIPADLLADATHPEKRVKSEADIPIWLHSEAYYDIIGFINGISTAIQGKKMSAEIYVSLAMKRLLEIFDKLNAIVDETPPIDQPQRFGNKAFRAWSRRMNHDVFHILQNCIPPEKCSFVAELGYYLSESFGNSVRIDYGTGHELSFIFFLCSLFKAGILEEKDNIACALRLFNTYLTFVRRLQKTYRMEPAGSHGVWSLDDYQFVPFIWGSAQLAFQSPFPPEKFMDEDIVNSSKNDYMFIACIDFIQQVKTGQFAEHSFQLWSISAVPSWSKINSGLVKMYQKEILSKFPIIQHVLFGKLMSFNTVKPGAMITNARLGFLQPAPPPPKITSNNMPSTIVGETAATSSHEITSMKQEITPNSATNASNTRNED